VADWYCASCNEKNFARREECRKCHAPKVTLLPQIISNANTPQTRPGDWFCMSCKNQNYSFRNECRRCNAPRTDTVVPMNSYPQIMQPQQNMNIYQMQPSQQQFYSPYSYVQNQPQLHVPSANPAASAYYRGTFGGFSGRGLEHVNVNHPTMYSGAVNLLSAQATPQTMNPWQAQQMAATNAMTASTSHHTRIGAGHRDRSRSRERRYK
jgi:Zn-finger in Ran binding protein and others